MKQVSKVRRSWSKEEDDKLCRQINAEANQNWKIVATKAGLKRTANSCRLRFVNHKKPGPRPGKPTVEEKLLILEFRNQHGKNCWAKIAKNLLPGRRDNDVKNYWHGLAKRAKREGRDVDGDAFRKRAELVEAIRAAGKFTMDYSSSISADAFEKLKELFPDIAAAGGDNVAEVAASSSFPRAVSSASDLGISNDLASSSAATDIGAAEDDSSLISDAYDFLKEMFPDIAGGAADSSPTDGELDAGTPGRVEHTVFSPYAGLVHRPTGFNQLPAALGFASTETSNQTLNHMQVEYKQNTRSGIVEQQGLNGDCLDHGGGSIGHNEAMAAAALGNTTSNEIDNAEEELDQDENKAFAEYFNFDDF